MEAEEHRGAEVGFVVLLAVEVDLRGVGVVVGVVVLQEGVPGRNAEEDEADSEEVLEVLVGVLVSAEVLAAVLVADVADEGVVVDFEGHNHQNNQSAFLLSLAQLLSQYRIFEDLKATNGPCCSINEHITRQQINLKVSRP